MSEMAQVCLRSTGCVTGESLERWKWLECVYGALEMARGHLQSARSVPSVTYRVIVRSSLNFQQLPMRPGHLSISINFLCDR